MGNSVQAAEYQLGTRVNARYDGNQNAYFPATIVKKHEHGRYDVKFENDSIKTVFWDDIQTNYTENQTQNHTPNQNNTNKSKTKFIENKSDVSDEFEIIEKCNINVIDDKQRKIFNVSLKEDDEKWTTFVNSFEPRISNKRQSIKFGLCCNEKCSFNISQIKKLDQLIEKIGGESLSKNIISTHKQDTSRKIIEKMQNIANSNQENVQNTQSGDDEIKFDNVFGYVSSMKSIQQLPNAKESQTFFEKHSLRYQIKLDLDYNETVTQNDKFTKEFISEMSCILNVDESLINIESTSQGSVILIVSVCAASFIFFLFGLFATHRLSFLVSRNQRRQSIGSRDGENLIEAHPGDEVIVLYRNEMYDATVSERHNSMNDNDCWIKVKYIGNPFMFANTEKIKLNSGRIRVKEPGSQYKVSINSDQSGNVDFEVIPVRGRSNDLCDPTVENSVRHFPNLNTCSNIIQTFSVLESHKFKLK